MKTHYWLITLVLIFLIVPLGWISRMHQNRPKCPQWGSNTSSGESATGSTSAPSNPLNTFLQNVGQINPVVTQTPAKSDVITEVTPYETPNPYVFPQAVKINGVPLQPAYQYNTPEYTKTYTLTGNAEGLLVNVVKGPLFIIYTVNPKYDCLQDPDSCRGTILVPVNNPYMSITVRDNQTNKIVAEDGYGQAVQLRYRQIYVFHLWKYFHFG